MNRRQYFIVFCTMGFLAAPTFAESMHGLEKEMHAMGGDLKVLGQQINDAPSNASSLKLIDDMEQHSMAAKEMTPPLVARAPAAEQPKMLAKFRGEIAHLIQVELDLEQALLQNDNAKAAGLLKTLHGLERQGHHDFRRRG